MYLNFAQELLKVFLGLLQDYIGTAHLKIGTKIKNDGTPVGNLDYVTLQTLRKLISKYFPRDYTLGEEDQKNDSQMTDILRRQNEFQWTIDGLDGTGNYRIGLNSYGAMVSRRLGDRILFAAFFRPIDEILRGNGFFFAEHGRGSFVYCKDHEAPHRLHTAQDGDLERTVVLLEGSSKKFFREPILSLGKVITTRPGFSTSIAATAVASGKASALITVENKPWDNWPMWLLIEEAGGIVTNWDGNPCTPENCGNIIAAANLEDHAKILPFLKQE